MKFTKTSEKQIREFMSKMDAKGCLPVTEWTSGSGRYTTNRALPPFVTRYERKKAVLVIDLEALYAFLFASANGQTIPQD